LAHVLLYTKAIISNPPQCRLKCKPFKFSWFKS